MKRVVMLFSHPLFGRGVESLLCGQTGMEVVGWERDANEFIEHIQDLCPDVVLIDGSDPTCDPVPVMMRLLKEGTGAKVITLNVQNNTMCVYCGERRIVKGVEDLVQAILQPSRPETIEIQMPGVVKEPEQETKAR